MHAEHQRIGFGRVVIVRYREHVVARGAADLDRGFLVQARERPRLPAARGAREPSRASARAARRATAGPATGRTTAAATRGPTRATRCRPPTRAPAARRRAVAAVVG